MSPRIAGAIAGVALLATFPLYGPYVTQSSRFYLGILTVALIYAIAAIGLDLVVGTTGQFSVAQGAFFGIAAYISAISASSMGLPVALSIVIAVIGCTVIGAIIGVIALRLHGHYLAIVTIGMVVVVQQVLSNWVKVTNGPLGFSGIPGLDGFFGLTEPTIEAEFEFVLLSFVIVLGVLLLITRSPFGDLLRAVRDDALAASYVGINVTACKVSAFMISSAYAGLAGALFAHSSGILVPDQFGLIFSATFLVMVLVGGRDHPIVVAVAAIALTALPEGLRAAAEFQQLFYGAALIIVIVAAPGGLAGVAGKLGTYVRRRALLRRTSEKTGGGT